VKKMVKLPKELQKKEKAKPKRTPPVKRRETAHFASRQVRRRMQQQGIEMDQVDATRVVIEGPEKSYVIENPEIILMKQMGQEFYQIVGEAEEYPSNEISISFGETTGGKVEEMEEEIKIKPEITENDILLVAAQANVDKEEARAALEDCEGDIAKAILFLKNRP